MMFFSKKLLFLLVLGLGISGSAFAQKNQDKNPPKGRPPVIEPKPKPPPEKETKPKKPDSAQAFWRSESGDEG